MSAARRTRIGGNKGARRGAAGARGENLKAVPDFRVGRFAFFFILDVISSLCIRVKGYF